MKKTTLILALIFLNLLTFAQDYISIKQEHIAHFESYKAIRIDSVTASGDTILYHNFRMIRHNAETDCFNRFGASWTGQNIMILPNGENLFVNKASDTITIKTNAVLGEEWLLYNYPDGRYITASISNHDTLSFLSVTDSVKTISLQVKDAEGNNISDNMNDRYLKLSKNYGFVRILDFYEFPVFEDNIYPQYDIIPEMDIIGIDDIGYQNYGAKEIYDFNVGDELHIHQYQAGDEYTAADDKYYIYKVIEEDSSENSITYTYDRCFKQVHYDYNNPDNSFISFTHDTTEVTYDFTSSYLQGLGNLSYEPYTENGYEWFFLRGKSICYDYFWGDDLNCLYLPTCSPYYCNNYYKGLGGPYYYGTSGFEPPAGRDLIYYKKGETEWGNPYSCGQLASVNELSEASGIKLYPNPAKSYIIIEQNTTDNKQHRITISNISGKNVLQTTSDAQHMKINVSHLKEGVYFINVKSGESMFTGKFVKIE